MFKLLKKFISLALIVVAIMLLGKETYLGFQSSILDGVLKFVEYSILTLLIVLVVVFLSEDN